MKKQFNRRLASVTKGSPADLAGLKAGDSILEINGFFPSDIIDFMWAAQDGYMDLLVSRKDKDFAVEFELEPGVDAGLQFEQEFFDGLKRCPNRCVFCFVDQQPKGLRDSLYVKDEDYRASFLHGNYITLTNLKDHEVDRIIEIRLSPLYVSVHSTDEKVRSKLLGREGLRPILPLLDDLGDCGIEFFTQIVLIPGWNDGLELDKTVRSLVERYPVIKGVAVVPVGLTKHREGLIDLPAVDEQCARDTLDRIQKLRKEAEDKCGHTLVYGADEFFLKARRELPPAEYYEDFDLLENGIGLMRLFLDELAMVVEEKRNKKLEKAADDIVIVTGEAAAPFFRDLVLPALESLSPPKIRIIEAENHLMGPSVTVAGLLSGKDIIKAMEEVVLPDKILICNYALLNGDGPFLDGMTIKEISTEIGCPVIAVPDSARDFVVNLFRPRVV